MKSERSPLPIYLEVNVFDLGEGIEPRVWAEVKDSKSEDNPETLWEGGDTQTISKLQDLIKQIRELVCPE